jgi:O-antigen/teichoic acid export membrane protein
MGGNITGMTPDGTVIVSEVFRLAKEDFTVRPQHLTSALTGPAAVLLSAVVSGGGSYVLLILVAKATSATGYADFAVFWSIVVTVGLGVYFPVEQETAREFAGAIPGARRGSLASIAFRFAGLISAALAVACLALLTPVGTEYLGSPWLVVALFVALAGYLLQFPVRGLLSGSRRPAAYASIVGLEGVLRIVLPALVILLGFASAPVFAIAVGVAAAGSAAPVLLQRNRGWLDGPDVALAGYASRVGRLIVAACSIQLLLNSGVLLARTVGSSDAVLAGQILTCISIARIPVFIYQALQVLYLPRVASAWRHKGTASAARLVALAVAAATVVGLVTFFGMWLLGPWLISVLFSPDLVLSTPLLLIVTGGVCVFIVALVLSDGVLATGGHTAVVRSWLIGVVAAVAVALAVQEPALRATLPLVFGATIAGGQLAAAAWTRLRSRA